MSKDIESKFVNNFENVQNNDTIEDIKRCSHNTTSLIGSDTIYNLIYGISPLILTETYEHCDQTMFINQYISS